jgi:hypothetical protein
MREDLLVLAREELPDGRSILEEFLSGFWEFSEFE